MIIESKSSAFFSPIVWDFSLFLSPHHHLNIYPQIVLSRAMLDASNGSHTQQGHHKLCSYDSTDVWSHLKFRNLNYEKEEKTEEHDKHLLNLHRTKNNILLAKINSETGYKLCFHAEHLRYRREETTACNIT